MSSKATEWPTEDLETVLACPLCACVERSACHSSLTDETFHVAEGKWELWRCDRCRSAWIDPRPSPSSIGRAYGSYYTHDEPAVALGAQGFRHALGNDYRNWRFGSDLRPSNRLGRWIVPLLPGLRFTAEQYFYFLPRRRRGESSTVLDVGCGNGEFLERAKMLGWNAKGIEPDDAAASFARSKGFDVRAEIEEFAGDGARFDAITLSHVIEHLHQPSGALKQLASLLRQGGQIFIATPNIDAVGHDIYGRHWRGLETPRHLVLFNRETLEVLLHQSGFVDVRFHPCPGALEFTAKSSRKMAAGMRPDDPEAQGVGPWPSRSELQEAAKPGRRSEFLVVTATKA